MGWVLGGGGRPPPGASGMGRAEAPRWVLARLEEAGGAGAERARVLLVGLREGAGASAGGLARALQEQHGVPEAHLAVLDHQGRRVAGPHVRLAADLGLVLVRREWGGRSEDGDNNKGASPPPAVCSPGELFTSAAPGGARERQAASSRLGFACTLDQVRVATLLDPEGYLGEEGWHRRSHRRLLSRVLWAALWCLLAILAGLAVWHVAVYPLPRPRVGRGHPLEEGDNHAATAVPGAVGAEGEWEVLLAASPETLDPGEAGGVVNGTGPGAARNASERTEGAATRRSGPVGEL